MVTYKIDLSSGFNYRLVSEIRRVKVFADSYLKSRQHPTYHLFIKMTFKIIFYAVIQFQIRL